jgi:hypothetical protein
MIQNGVLEPDVSNVGFNSVSDIGRIVAFSMFAAGVLLAFIQELFFGLAPDCEVAIRPKITAADLFGLFFPKCHMSLLLSKNLLI